MRELAKSMMRFSWALSVFGLEQVGKLVKDEHGGKREQGLRSAFDAVSEATEAQLGRRERSIYDAGDRLQREAVEMVFDTACSPDTAVKRAADLVDRSADALRDIVNDKDAKHDETTGARTAKTGSKG